jgi:hypothetical protein
MKILTKYRRLCGTILGSTGVPDDFDADLSTADVGIYEGEADPATQYVSAGALATRSTVPGVAINATVIALGGSAIVTGLPACWLRIRGQFIAASGSYTFTPADVGEYVLELVGAHRGSVTVTVQSAIDSARDIDPRWAAIKAATPAQIDAWLTANVTNIATARDVLKTLLLAVRSINERI